jgi:hypothetical protein
MARSIYTAAKGVRTHEESIGTIQPKKNTLTGFNNWKANNYNNANRWR